MPHDQCPPSRRGHSWRELTVADQLGPKLSCASIATTVKIAKIAPALRICKRCDKLGHVNKQGVISLVEIKAATAPLEESV